jgi:hypothetical protein
MLAPLRAEPVWAEWKYPRNQRFYALACGKGKREPHDLSPLIVPKEPDRYPAAGNAAS